VEKWNRERNVYCDLEAGSGMLDKRKVSQEIMILTAV